MATPVLQREESAPAPSRRKRWMWVGVLSVIGLAAALVATVAISFVVFHAKEGRPLPTFPSLAEQPDRSLQGTVAYYASGTRCVRIVAAAGQPSKDVLCLPQESTQTWLTQGKPAGPQLVWRDDGRLEVTMFRWLPSTAAPKSPPPLTPGWQKIVDVRTGTVEDVPAAKLPSAPNMTTQPTVGPSGRVSFTSDGATGRVTVTLTDANGSRTLLSVHGPGEYVYSFGPVFWAPNWQWIAASDDGRILVITPTDPAVTRVLVTGTGGGAGGGEAGPAFAVTTTNYLATK